MGSQTQPAPALNNDLIVGARSIAEYVFGSEDESRRIYHLARKGEIPTFILGGKLCARKSAIVSAISQKEQRTSAA